MSPQARQRVLRLAGILLVALGLLHLAVTPFIARFVRDGARPGADAWLMAPMLLNHVVVGILLLPLGVLTAVAAPAAARAERWALVQTRVTAVAVAALPVAVWALMGGRYFGALPFLCATVLVSAACLALLAAAFWPARARGAASPAGADERVGSP
jgi:uncharacterized membrane protein